MAVSWYCSSAVYIPQVCSCLYSLVAAGVSSKVIFKSDNCLEVYKIHQFPPLTYLCIPSFPACPVFSGYVYNHRHTCTPAPPHCPHQRQHTSPVSPSYCLPLSCGLRIDPGNLLPLSFPLYWLLNGGWDLKAPEKQDRVWRRTPNQKEEGSAFPNLLCPVLHPSGTETARETATVKEV